jgi:4-hydroxy-3-methylbut-2-enyl diphosphate reductase
VEFNRQRRKIVGSRRAVLTENREQMEDQIWNNIEVGKKYTGTVKSLMDFGAFVDIGGVDGLVHVSEMSWTKVKHPSDVLKVGDKVEVTVLEFDTEKKRISLTMKKEEDNPWFKASEKYKVGDVVKGTVVRLVPFGAFVELEKGLDGLVHISQISDVRIAKPGDVLHTGQEVEARIVEVNEEAKKISLSIKEVNPINPVVPESEQKQEEPAGNDAGSKEEVPAAVEEAIPNEHKEELKNTIGDVFGSLEESK